MRKINLTGAVVMIIAFFTVSLSAITKPFIVRRDKKKMEVRSIEADAHGVLTYKLTKFSQKIKPSDYICPCSNAGRC